MSPEKLSPGAAMRAARDARFAERGIVVPAVPAAARPYAAQEASQRESRFLKNLGAAKEDFDWIKANEAWRTLGHDSFTAWWETRVAPIMVALGMRPTREVSSEVVDRVLADDAAAPTRERHSKSEIAQLAGVSTKTVHRRSQDRDLGTLSQDHIDHKHCEACGTALDVGTIKAAQYRCTKCDPDRIHAGAEHGKPCMACEADEAETAALVGDNETSAAGPAATTGGAFPPAGEPVDVGVAAASTGTQTAAEGADTTEADGAEVDGTTAGQAFRSGDAPAPDGDAAPSSSGVTPTDSPAAASTPPPTDEALPPEPGPQQQPGQDSPTGREGGRSETIHQQVAGVSPAGVAPGSGSGPQHADPVEPVELEDVDAAVTPSSSDPDEEEEATPTDLLFRLFGALMTLIDHVDAEAVGPQLFLAEVEQLHQHVDALTAFVAKVSMAHFQASQRTP